MSSVSRGCERGPAAQRAPPVLSREGQGSAQGSRITAEAPKGSAASQPCTTSTDWRMPPQGILASLGGLWAYRRADCSREACSLFQTQPPHHRAHAKNLHPKIRTPTPSEGRGHRQQQGFPEGCAVWPRDLPPRCPYPRPPGKPSTATSAFYNPNTTCGPAKGNRPFSHQQPSRSRPNTSPVPYQNQIIASIITFLCLLSSICIVLF